MKKVFSVILSVILLLGASGCGLRAPDAAPEETELYLSRAEHTSVYGVESPDSNRVDLLDGAASQAVPDLEQLAAGVPATTENTQVLAAEEAEEIRAVWISFLTLEPMAKGKTKAQFTANIGGAFKKAADFGCNTVYVQVRPFADALYDSAYFPWSRYLTGTEGKNPGYDPLKIMCALADQYGLRIEAWINPYRVRKDDQPMSADNQAVRWLKAGNPAALEWNDGVYYNPGSPEARKLIINGVKEIVQNYAVDGIHFDDYFYPTTDFAFDQATYRASKSKLSQADWRRENVNILVRDVYKAVKAIDPTCVFGISPQGNVKINYEGQFADVAKWVSNTGYVDYICPQIYYGYNNGICPYAQTVKQWDEMITVPGIDLYIGIGAYKLGKTDQWAGEGKNEWIGTSDLLAKMVKTARGADHYSGIALYSHESLFGADSKQLQAERANLKKIL